MWAIRPSSVYLPLLRTLVHAGHLTTNGRAFVRPGGDRRRG